MKFLVQPVLFLTLAITTSSNFPLLGQTTNFSLNKLNKRIPLLKGYLISIRPAEGQPERTFTVADSVSWLISNNALLKAGYYEKKSELTDSLIKIVEKENQNLILQKDATLDALKFETQTNNKFMDLLKEDRSIAEQSLNLVNKVKLKAGIATTLVSLAAGLFWIRKDNEVWLNVLKVVGTTGAGLLISFSLY
jgi:hypothetical protein